MRLLVARILRDIVEHIAEADLVVADLTGLNANVFYELGVAHALRVVLLTQNLEELPFGLRSYRMVAYHTHFARIEQARQLLRETAKGAFTGTIEFGNPVTDFLRASGKEISDIPQPGGNVTDKPPPASLEAEKQGLLDHLDALTGGFERLTEILKEIGQASAQIGDVTTRHTELASLARKPGEEAWRGSLARKNAEPNVHTKLRFLVREYARTLADYGQQLATSNEAYEVVAQEMQDSIEFIILHNNLPDQDAVAKLGEFVTMLRGLEQTASGTRDLFAGTRSTVKDLEGIERNMTRSAKVVGRELNRLVNNVDKTIASVHRGVEIGMKRLGPDAPKAGNA